MTTLAVPHRALIDAKLMRKAIDACGLSQREIAKRLDVAEKTVWRWANDRARMDAWAWPRFLDLIGLGADWQPTPQGDPEA